MDELIRKQDALDALMAERKRLLANGQKGAEHVLTHHGYNVIDELPPVQSDVLDTNVGEMTLISMDDALNVVKDTIAKAFENLPHHYDEEVDDEVYDDMGKVNLLLEVNKEIKANIRKLERRNG